MKPIAITIAAVVSCGTALFFVENQTRPGQVFLRSTPAALRLRTEAHPVIHASGRVQGRTEEIELRSRLTEQISEIHVTKGQLVSKGTVLLSLDAAKLSHERDLAQAMLSIAVANRDKLENGSRASEIETTRQEYEATLARQLRAEKSYERGKLLAENQAISQEAFDELAGEVSATRAIAAAAKGRLETIELPARDDDLMAACGTVRAADARLNIAQLNLDNAQVRSPIDGRILYVEAEVGEQTGPDSPEPLIIMADTTQLRVVAEVDEYDAMKVRLGQPCEIRADATEGLLASGHIAEIEPRMKPKQLFGQWAGERTDTSTIRVWINLIEIQDLPIGLPVEVLITDHKVPAR
jgi:multidrug resistance efflux pump